MESGWSLLASAFTFLPLGMDIAFYVAMQVMNNNFALGDLLLYAITVSMIVVGSIMIAKPGWFARPRNVAIAVGAIMVISFLTWFLGTGQHL